MGKNEEHSKRNNQAGGARERHTVHCRSVRNWHRAAYASKEWQDTTQIQGFSVPVPAMHKVSQIPGGWETAKGLMGAVLTPGLHFPRFPFLLFPEPPAPSIPQQMSLKSSPSQGDFLGLQSGSYPAQNWLV